MPVKQASAKVVRVLVKDWSPQVVRCRSWAHSWDDYDVLETRKRYVVVQLCNRCNAVRHRSVSTKNGRPLGPWVTQLPPGYAVPPGTGRITLNTAPIVWQAAVAASPRRTVKEDQVGNELRQLQKVAFQ